MTDTHGNPSQSVSKFALFWLCVAGTLGLIVFLLITFKNPVLAFGKWVFPFLDVM